MLARERAARPGAVPLRGRQPALIRPPIEPRMPTSAIPIARCIAVRRRAGSRPYRPSMAMTTPKAAGIRAVGLTMSLMT